MLVRVRWVGRGWRDDWVSVTQLNEATKREARRMEARLYGLPPLRQERPTPTRVQPKRGRCDLDEGDAEVLMRPHRRMKGWRAVIGDDDSESDDEEMVTWRPARGSLVRRRRGAVIYDSDNDELGEHLNFWRFCAIS